MTKVEIKKASAPLSEFAERARKGPIIVTKHGKPFAAVVAIRNADEESIALSTSRKFQKIIAKSRARAKKEGGIAASELRHRLGLAK
jgi:prevent-host-death family protein